MFQHNERINTRNEGRLALPITAYSLHQNEDVVEHFGLSAKPTESLPKAEHQEHKTPMDNLRYKHVQEAILECSIPIESGQHSNDDEQIIPENEAWEIFMQAISSFYVSLDLKRMSDTSDYSGTNIFFTSFLAVMESVCRSQANTDSTHMEHLLSSWNVRRVRVQGDGNCMSFYIHSTQPSARVKDGDRATTERLHLIGVPLCHFQDVNYIQRLLRIRMVEEWNDHLEYYQGFITADISTLTHEYLQSGHFSGNVGDLMVLTIANVLQFPVTLFTSVPNMPLLCILPTSQMVHGDNTANSACL